MATTTAIEPYGQNEDEEKGEDQDRLPVNPSFLLHDGHAHRLRFFLSTLDAVNGDIESANELASITE